LGGLCNQHILASVLSALKYVLIYPEYYWKTPCGIGIDSSKGLAYVANFASAYIAVVDIKNQQVVDKIPIGLEGQLIDVDADEHKIYVAFDDLDKIVKINGDNNEIETVIELECRIPYDMVIDSVSQQ
jgi:DNA-binding beta-propeller fold protein YncE